LSGLHAAFATALATGKAEPFELVRAVQAGELYFPFAGGTVTTAPIGNLGIALLGSAKRCTFGIDCIQIQTPAPILD